MTNLSLVLKKLCFEGINHSYNNRYVIGYYGDDLQRARFMPILQNRSPYCRPSFILNRPNETVTLSSLFSGRSPIIISLDRYSLKMLLIKFLYLIFAVPEILTTVIVKVKVPIDIQLPTFRRSLLSRPSGFK